VSFEKRGTLLSGITIKSEGIQFLGKLSEQLQEEERKSTFTTDVELFFAIKCSHSLSRITLCLDLEWLNS